MAVNIQITGDNAAEAAKELRAFASFMVVQPAASVETAVTAEIERQAKRTRKPSEKAEKAEPVKEQPPVEDQPKTETSEEEENIPTIVELRSAASNKKKETKALLNELGYSGLSNIPEEERSGFLKKLEAL